MTAGSTSSIRDGCQRGLRSLSTTIARTPSAKSGCRIVVRVSAQFGRLALRQGQVRTAPQRLRASSTKPTATPSAMWPGCSLPRRRRAPRGGARSRPPCRRRSSDRSPRVAPPARTAAAARQCGPSAPGPSVCQRMRQRGQVRARREMRRQSSVDRVGALHAHPGQAEIRADPAWQARQKERRADIREEADRGLRHGERGMLGGDPIRRMHRHADAAAHADAVDQRDIRLRIGGDHQIQLVLLAEERLGLVMLAIELVLAQRADIAAGAEGAIAGALDHHAVHMRVVSPTRSERGCRRGSSPGRAR